MEMRNFCCALLNFWTEDKKTECVLFIEQVSKVIRNWLSACTSRFELTIKIIQFEKRMVKLIKLKNF